jgi:hypothetical protein
MADFDDTNGDDILFGTDEDHAIRGFAGNDFPSGAGRNDLIPACSEDVCIRIMPAAHATTDWVSFAVRRKALTADRIRSSGRYLGISMLVALPLTLAAGQADAASSAGCEGGGFIVMGRTMPQGVSTIPANSIAASFRVQGKYVQFDIDSDSLGIRNYTMTGAPNQLDITGGVVTPVFASKLPDHQGLTLNSALTVELKDENLEIQRTGAGVSMKLQAKDCATGGIFQMEVERQDGVPTLFTHILAEKAFYFDNRNFRNREGDVVPFKDTTIVVPSRVNFGNNTRKFVGRDSAQVATRRQEPGCVNQIATRFPATPIAIVRHCGGISRWDVASGGRMGQVMGEDAVEVAPPPTDCVHKCQAQNQVRGRSTVLGFPFPVDPADQLKPRFPAQPVPGAAALSVPSSVLTQR